MTFIRGNVLLPRGTPFREKSPWDYVPGFKEGLRKETLIPLPEAKVRVVLPESGTLVTQGLTSDEGEFFLRVPKREKYLLEVFFERKLIALSFVEVREEKELDIGTVDSLSTAYAFWKKKELKMGEELSPPFLAKLQREIERLWKKGRGLEGLRMVKELEEGSSRDLLDPFGLIESFHFSLDSGNDKLLIAWKSREEVEASLFYRSFRAGHYAREGTPFQREGQFVLKLREFEGYLFYLEVQTQNHTLGRTPLYSLRAPVVPLRRQIDLVGRQEGPLTVGRKEVSGHRKLILLDREGRREVNVTLQNVLERHFEAELTFSFLRRGDIPRYFVREGFEEVEFTLYLPEEHSVLWGAVGTSPGVRISKADWEYLLRRFRTIVPQISSRDLVEVGYSFPFAEVVAYRGGEYFRLFSNVDLENPLLLIASRKLDSLDLETVLYYRGMLNLFGEGLFEDYVIELDFEGKFEEDVEEEHQFGQRWGECAGKVKFWVDLEMKPRDKGTGRG
ncbi:MAG: hypothetical protein ACP5Q4_05315 [Candidatus Caldatribacteriaceae bacterium]